MLARVAVMVALAAGHLFHADHAAFQFVAIQMLKLDGGVADVEALLEQVIEPRQYDGAL